MLQVRDLRCPGLEPVSLAVEDGACAALIGPSGAGKSRVLRAIADLDPNTGAVSADGLDRAAVSAPEWRRRVRFLAAEPAWWAPGIGAHFPAAAEVAPLMAELDLPADCLDWPVERASTGQRQRLALIRGLLDDPAVLLSDEPTAALDTAARERVEALLAQRLARGTSIVVATHDMAQAARLAGATYRSDAGRIATVEQ